MGCFARAKYFRNYQLVKKSKSSPLWDSIVSHEEGLQANCQWIVSSGNISFWSDNWLGSPLVGHLPCDPKLCVNEALANIQEFINWIHAHLLGKIHSISISPLLKEQLKFALTEDGEFSSKAYMELIRAPGYKRLWARMVWQNFMAPKINTFLWKLIRQALPVDSRIIAKGIASKCRCCNSPDVESTIHLFLLSDIASEV